jgi:uncharacterized protein YegP (UPF0339 family)
MPLPELCDIKINGKTHPDPASIKDMAGIPVTVGGTFTMRLAAAAMAIVKVPEAKEAPIKYEAEKVAVTGGAYLSSDGESFSGSAFVTGYDKKPDASTTFKISAPAGGKYMVVLRYANGTGRDQAVALYLNNTYLKDSVCPALDNWNVWGDKAEILALVPGNNEISYRNSRNAISMNIDYILLISEAASGEQKVAIYEAENAALTRGAWAATSHQGYSGSAYVEGFYNNIGAALAFKVKVQTAGKYNVTLHFSNSMGSEQKISIYVNGVKVADPSYPNLKDWATWSDKTETLTLKAGENTITYTSAQGDGCINFDYIKVEPE